MKSIVGYANRWSAKAGDTVEFKVSTYGRERYRADLVRIICGDDDPHRGLFCEEEIEAPFNGTHKGRTQEMTAGSCVIVPQPDAAERLASFTVQAWIYPTLPGGREQGIITHWDGAASCGFALVITAAGTLALRTGDGAIHELSLETRLESRRWHLVAGTFDAATGTLGLYLDRLSSEVEAGQNAHASGEGGFRPASRSLVIAAGEAGGSDHFNGKIDRPIVTGRALEAREIEALAWSGSPHEREPAVVGAWDFSQDIGCSQVTDAGYHRLHGRTVNLPSRGVKGFNWSGREQNWRHAPSEYGAIHFHEDDHYDAGWQTDFTFTVPATLASGVYAARLRAGDDEWHVTFFVRPPPGTATARLAFLASTATYMAYSNYRWHMSEPFAEVAETFWTTLTPNDIFLQEHDEFGLSTYDTHADGSGVRYASRLRPVLNMAPRTPLWSFNPDTHILAWLEHCGFAFDVITDEDLHREGTGLLQPYRAVVTGTHPEYYTTPMWDGMRGYLSQGGRLAYLGGNGFIWRCAFSDEWPGALELRRAEDGIRYRDEEPGEYYLEFTGEYGGLWRRLGMAPQALVGVGTVAVGFDRSGFYRRTPESLDPRASFIFEGIGRDELIGTFGIQGGGASGSEIDATDPRLGTPRHALVVARSEGHSADTWLVPDETGFHHSAMDGVQNPDIRADMTFFETPSGGAVFSTGSIAWGASLPHAGWQNNVATVTGNVLNRFLDPEPFAMPAGTPES
ncbi:MAG: LamG domain-containing protein [bacterium]|nr:LamG domain-containing protein [bacterium]